MWIGAQFDIVDAQPSRKLNTNWTRGTPDTTTYIDPRRTNDTDGMEHGIIVALQYAPELIMKVPKEIIFVRSNLLARIMRWDIKLKLEWKLI